MCALLITLNCLQYDVETQYELRARAIEDFWQLLEEPDIRDQLSRMQVRSYGTLTDARIHITALMKVPNGLFISSKCHVQFTFKF
mgnify:CR=1 FL=1